MVECPACFHRMDMQGDIFLVCEKCSFYFILYSCGDGTSAVEEFRLNDFIVVSGHTFMCGSREIINYVK